MGVQLSGAGSGAAAALAAGAGALLAGTVADSGCMCIGVRPNGLPPLHRQATQTLSSCYPHLEGIYVQHLFIHRMCRIQRGTAYKAAVPERGAAEGLRIWGERQGRRCRAIAEAKSAGAHRVERPVFQGEGRMAQWCAGCAAALCWRWLLRSRAEPRSRPKGRSSCQRAVAQQRHIASKEVLIRGISAFYAVSCTSQLPILEVLWKLSDD